MVMTASDLLRFAIIQLEKAEIENAHNEARWLVESALGVDMRIPNVLAREATENECAEVLKMLARRVAGEPLQYIIGEWEFFGLTFKVGEGVLIPRQDTETLVETAISYADKIFKPRILDLCSGTGCIPIAIESMAPNAELSAVELSEKAFFYLTENIKLHGSSLKAYNCDALDSAVAWEFRELDIITANPPYLTESDMTNLQSEVGFEPKTALFGGDDGLNFYRALTSIWKHSLREGGALIYEVGATQAVDVEEILLENGFSNIKTVKDLCGNDRVVCGEKF